MKKLVIVIVGVFYLFFTHLGFGQWTWFQSNSNMRVQLKPGIYSPINTTYAVGMPGTFIEDYIEELTPAGDIELIDFAGNDVFNYLPANANNGFNFNYGKFWFEGTSDIGIDTGIVLNSGRVWYSYGPDTTGPGDYPGICHTAEYHSTGFNLGLNGYAEPTDLQLDRSPQYPELVALNNGDSIWEANVLDIDFVPKGDMIRLEYVFASEEYGQDPCAAPTDVMGLFLSGPGIVGQQNIALVPGTNAPVGVHSIHPPQLACHPENPGGSPYYVDNTGGQNVIYDGFTTVLTASAYVNPCDTYHLRIAVADGAMHSNDTLLLMPGNSYHRLAYYKDSTTGRMLYDSGIFLKSRSFRSTDSLWIEALGGTALSSSYPYVVRGCLDGKLRVHSATAWPLDRELELDIQGTAVMGTDYQAFNTTVTIPANETFVDIEIVPLSGGLGTTATLIARLKSPYGACANLGNYLDTDTLLITDDYYIAAEPQDTTICAGCSAQLRVQGEDFLDYSWSPGTGLDNPNTKEPVASPSGSTQYVVTATPPTGYPCAGSSDSVTINVGSSGIDEVGTKSQLQVYPNPFTTGFTIQIAEGNQETVYVLKLYNILGQVVYQAKDRIEDLNAGLSSIGKSIPSGSYWLWLSNEDSNAYRKQVVRW